MRKGEFLELLVSELEYAIDPGVTITSPDLVPGRESGNQREVDVTLRRRVGSTETLVMIECRDRSRPQNVEWIDALIGKAKDIRASTTVAVSRSGFTRAAQRRAVEEGIELRTVSAVAPADLARWFGFKMVVGVTRGRLRQIVGITSDDRGFLEQEDTPGAVLFPNRTRPMIRLPGGDDLISLEQLWRESFSEFMTRDASGLPRGGETVECCISLAAGEAPIQIVIDQVTYQLRLLEFGVELRCEAQPVAPLLVEQYREDAGVLSQLAMYSFAHGDELFTVTLREAPPIGERHLLPFAAETKA
jgi:hypothetical protein